MSTVPDTEQITSALNEARRAIEASGQSRATIDAAIVDIRAQIAAVKEAQDAAALEAAGRPVGTDAEVVRAYCVEATTPSAVLDISSARGADWTQARSTHLGRKGAGQVRLLAETDEVGDVHYGLLDDPKPRSAWQADLQTQVSLRSLARLVRARSTPMLDRRIGRLLRAAPREIARMFADNATEGAEFMPTAVSAMLDRYAALPRAVASLFQVAQIGAVDVVNPFVSQGAVPKLVGVPVSGDNNPAVIGVGTPTTASRTMTAATIAVNILANLDASEDSIVAFGPWALSEIAIALADAQEDAIINGDTTSTHEDTIASWTGGGRWPSTGMGGSDDHRRAYKGLRRLAIDSSAAASGTDTVVGAISQRASLTGAHRAGDLAYIVNLANLIAKLLTDSNFLTMDKAGSLATLITSQIGAMGGYPVVISEFLTEDLNASGLFDNVTTTKTGRLLVNRAQFKIVQRRGPQTEISRVPWQHVQYVTGTARLGFFDVQSVSSTKKTVSFDYNLAKS